MDTKEIAAESPRYSATTHGVTVTIFPEFVPRESKPEQSIYVFAYHVTIENRSERKVQLINRHWIVISGGSQIADVKGEGVVGLQPVMEKNAGFTYSSWTVVHDSVGAMFGTYTFRSETGEFFDVKIPRFDLIHIDSATVH